LRGEQKGIEPKGGRNHKLPQGTKEKRKGKRGQRAKIKVSKVRREQKRNESRREGIKKAAKGLGRKDSEVGTVVKRMVQPGSSGKKKPNGTTCRNPCRSPGK